jgi:hypothetical protein
MFWLKNWRALLLCLAPDRCAKDRTGFPLERIAASSS